MTRPPRSRARWRRPAALLFGCLLAAACAEGCLRFLLFHPSALARRLGAGLRSARYYADADWEDDYWKLRVLFAKPGQLKDAPRPDAELGWLGTLIEPGSFAHKDEPAVAGRRPVLLYGDSFAQCNTPPGQCFQAVLESTSLSRDHALLNYGVGGYGVDQICLMLEHSIERWSERDPIVIVGILVESDLDRGLLGLRDWPKPQFLREGDDWVLARVEEHDLAAFVAARPPQIGAYGLRYLCNKPGLLPHGWRRELRRWRAPSARKWALNAYLLERIHTLLETRGIEYFFCLFHAEEAFASADAAGRDEERFLTRKLNELGAPWVSTRPALESVFARGVPAERLYGRSGKLLGHHTPLGNRVVFEALRAGIERRFDAANLLGFPPSLERSLANAGEERAELDTILGVAAQRLERSAEACSRFEPARAPDFKRRWLLRSGEWGPTEIELRLAGSRGRFSATVTPPASGVLWIEVDGERRTSLEGAAGAQPERIELDVTGARQMTILVAGAGAWWELGMPQLRETRPAER